jgi:SAM-dependent methyltransferase
LPRLTFLKGLADSVERGSFKPVGNFIPFDFSNVRNNDISEIPEESVDLVTLNMGLHHLHQEDVSEFLKIVKKILRPGGVFIVREHDARPDLIPILDLAHSVFNVVTGVTLENERTEIRAFRSVKDWCKILEGAGFQNVFMYGLEKTDPTEDYMLTFIKPPNSKTSENSVDSKIIKSPNSATGAILPVNNERDKKIRDQANNLLRLLGRGERRGGLKN